MGDETRRRNARDAIRRGMAALLSALLFLSMVPAVAIAEPMAEEPLQSTEPRNAGGDASGASSQPGTTSAQTQATSQPPDSADVSKTALEATLEEGSAVESSGPTGDVPKTTSTNPSESSELGTQPLESADPASGRCGQAEEERPSNGVAASACAESEALAAESDAGGKTRDGKASPSADTLLPDVVLRDGSPVLAYQTHVQNDGWQTWRRDGDMSGTAARSLRLEGINIKLERQPCSGGIQYRTHVQNVGWQGWVANGAMSGTSGRSLRLEAIEIKLTGEMANRYDVYYRVHAQNIGWMSWAKNGGRAGSACHGYRLEAIQIVLVPRGGAAPGRTCKGITQTSDQSYVTHLVQYRTHVQNDGWQGFVYDGAVSGTSGRSLRLEGMIMSLPDAPYSGGIEYRTHVQNIGWQGWVANGAMSGTSGRSLRLEAMQVRLTGEMANRYDVWYRVHAQNFGWMGWAKNGASAGTAGYAYRLEAMQVRLVPKGGAAPGSTTNAYRQNGAQIFVGTVRIVNARQVHELNKQCAVYGPDSVPASVSGYMGRGFDPDRSTYAVLMLDGKQRITGIQASNPNTTRTCIYILLGRKDVYNGRSREDSVSRWRAYDGKRACVAGKVTYPAGLDLPLTAWLNDRGYDGELLYTL